MGDLGIPMFVFAKSLRMAPPQIAEAVALKAAKTDIGEILAVGPYVNIKLDKANETYSENTTPDVHKTYNINYIEFMKKAKELADEKGFKIYSTFDTGHAKINGFDAVEYAKKIFDLGIDIITLHLHDNDGKNDSHWAAGSVYNGINFGDVLDLFKKLKYDVNAVIEHWNNNYNALEYLQNL